MVHRLYNAADMCYIASVNGWAGYPVFVAVDKWTKSRKKYDRIE
jgi:hypothetical protein